MAELYAKPFETIETGYNPQQPQNGGQENEMDSYLSSLPPEERQAAIARINAPLSGEELALMAGSGQKMPTLEEYAEIEKWHKTQEISFFDGLGKIAEGGEQVMADLSKAFGAVFDNPSDVASKMPATAVEAFSQGTRNFYGMLAESQNTDSVLFRVKDFLNGTGTIEDRYNQYISALKFNKDSAELAEGKQTLVMDKDMINHEVTQAMAYIADPTLFIPFGKIASTGLRAVGLGERLALASAKSAAIKNGIIGNTIKWGVGQPLEFLGGAVRNTIDFGLDKAGEAFEATTGVGAKEFAQTARMSGIGFSASAVAGYAVPYASTLSDAYLVGSSARGFGEALTLVGDTISKNKFGRGINSWAAESLEQAKKNGVKLSPHANGLLKALNAVDPMFAYGWNAVEASAQGAVIGGGLGYLSGGQEGMYSGIGAGVALGAVGGTAGKMVADVTGGTNVARRVVQAKMVIEGHKVTNPEKAMFFQAMQKTAEARGQDVDLVNGIIAGIDKVAPNFEFHAMTPDQFEVEAKKKGYNPSTGKFMELSAIDHEFGGDRPSKSKAMYILRSIGGDFVGDSKTFLEVLKKASAKDSANPNKPAGNIPLNLRKYTDVAKTFDKLTKTQQDAILREIDGQADVAKELGGKTKLRDHYDSLTWSEAWTDSLVKKFESDREGARKDIIDMLAQETGKDGKLNRKGRALADKLRAEGFLDKENKLLRERNLLQADMTLMEFASVKGGVMRREADGKTHMYINLNKMGSETFPHELFHTIMRESPMKDHFTKSLIGKLIGSFDDKGNLVRTGEVNINQVRKFFKKYIDLTSYNEDGTLNPDKSSETMKLVDEALAEFESAGSNKKISDKSRGLLEKYTEEFGAYYFSHWLMGRNRNTLFFGGELRGIEGLVERTKDSFKDFWQSKISKSNPEFDFSEGLNASFDRSKGLGRISSIDYYMRDMVRAASNANREAFNPDAMSVENLRDFERSNGLRNLTTQDGNRRLNPREQVTQNIRLGKEAHKILTGLDKNLRTSNDTIDENGKSVITGRLSENELDALVKGGIVPRAWADKVNQGYAMLDGTVSNVFSAGYLGKTEQTTDASYPRRTGKDVAFKNRKAVLFDVETKIKADGTFYTLFHTLDLAVIEQEANRLFQNTEYRKLFDGDRSVMEADFFRYISNASKASTDPKKLDSAALLEKGDGLGAARRDVMHQMGRMALQTGDAYKHQPIAVIPEGIRHSVTTFNIDGMTTPRVESGARYDINMKNAHKFIRENWQPDDMVQEKTNNGVMMTHESGFKFSNINGKTTAYTSAGRKIGSFDSIKQATEAAKREYHKVYDNIENGVRESVAEQDKIAIKFQPLDENERAEAIRIGDVFELPSMKAFIGDRTLLRQTRDEHIYQRALEAIENPEQLLAHAERISADNLKIGLEYQRMTKEWDALSDRYEDSKSAFRDDHDLRLGKLRRKYKIPDDFDEWISYQKDEGKWNPPESKFGSFSPEYKKYKSEAFARYEADAKSAYSRFFADQEYIAQMDLYNKWQESVKKDTKFVLDEFDKIEEFKKKNKEAIENPIFTALDTLGQYSTAETTRAEKAEMFAKYVEANANQKDYSGLLEALFAGEYDDKIQTGKPFVAVTTHGTGNLELMMSRLFAADKLGSHYDIPSSRMGSFSAGSQNTSKAYARKPEVIDRSPVARFKRLTSFLNEEGMTDKTTEQYKLTQDFIDLYRGHLESLGYDEGTVDTLWRGFLHQRNPFNTSLELERFPQKVVDAWRELVKKDNESLPPPAPDKQMQLRKVIRMDNPYVVVDPRSYEEHYISPHMKRAMEAGHDGIIFKRFADGGQRDNVYVVFKDYMKDNIKPIDTSFDDVSVPRGKDESGRVLKTGRELRLDFQPTDEAEGGRVYDFNSPKFKSSFIGKYAEENPERLQNKNLEFVKRRDGSYRITMTDNSGATKKIGHITADLDMSVKGEGIAVISSNIDKKFRGNKLANVLYSEMAERLRAMGVKYVDGTIVNPEGIPVQVRNSVIGQTYYKGSNKPALREDAAKKIQAIQSIYPSKGIEVYNELDFNARYQPSEGWEKSRELGMKSTWNNLPEVSRKLLQLNIDTFGLTNNAYEAGYLLPDARMLDFSGRSQSSGFKRVNGKNVPTTKFDDFKDSRHIDHREAEMLPEDGNVDDVISRMQEAGAIRFDHNDGSTYVDIGSVPTLKQYDALINILKFHTENPKEHTFAVDIRKGKNIESPVYITDVSNPSRVIAELKREVNRIYNTKSEPKSNYQPADGEQGGNKARYDIDKAIVEKLKEKFKGYKNLTAKDMLEFIVENKGQFSPLALRMLESLDDHGLGAFVQQQTSTLGSTQKGTRGQTYHNYNPNNNTVNMLLERNVERRRGWTNSFEELMMEEILHAVTTEKIPDVIKHGSTIENTLKNVDHFLRNKKKYEYQWREEWKTEGGATEDWFVIADAYKQVHKHFASGKFPDGTAIDKNAKHFIEYRLTNMGEFVVGITQDNYVQKILSQIKVPKTERSILTRLLEAIKRIWNFDDSVIDSLLAHTSDAVGTVIQRKKIGFETVGTGRFPEKSKQYFDGMPEPKFQPAEGWRDWQSERTSVGSVIKNTAGYLIMVQRGKFKVYNPAKAIIGIYDNEDQAKRRVQKDEPRQ